MPSVAAALDVHAARRSRLLRESVDNGSLRLVKFPGGASGERLEAGAEHARPRDLAFGDLGVRMLLDDEAATSVRPLKPVAETVALADDAGGGRLDQFHGVMGREPRAEDQVVVHLPRYG